MHSPTEKVSTTTHACAGCEHNAAEIALMKKELSSMARKLERISDRSPALVREPEGYRP